MNEIVSATPCLDPKVPRIIVTEPSPMINGAVGVAKPENTSEETAKLIGKSAETAVVTSPSVQTDVQIESSSDSSVEYNSLPDCTQCENPLSGSIVRESRINLEQDSDRTGLGKSELEPTSEHWCCPSFGGCSGFCYAASKALDTRKYAILLWMLLMILPISSMCMGLMYLNQCKLGLILPHLLLMLGVSGIAVLTARICVTCFWNTNKQLVENMRSILRAAHIVGLIFLITEICTFWRYSPSLDNESEEYCEPTFYNFTFWWNTVTVIVVVIIIIIQFPRFKENCRDV